MLRAVHQFRARLDRYKLVSKRVIRDELLRDGKVEHAIREHCRTHGVSELDARVRVERYVDEIVPYFNVLSYYKLGYNVARVLINLLYRVSSEYQDRAALNAIPRKDIVVYLMNHRSNADYAVVAYVLARAVSISYAVGEWARVWPLEYVFKSFGAYFVRRGFREPLYHVVLERYVQLITRHGVTQGVFLEGGLTRDGAFRGPKLGLLDYIARTLPELEADRNIWLVPVALNYDRVLEDRSLILELLDEQARPGRVRQLLGVLHYVAFNLARLLTGNLRRYGRVAVNFGTPVPLRQWVEQRPGVFELPKENRLQELEGLANEVMGRVAQIMPITPVPLVAAALLSFGETLVRRNDLLERVDEFRDHLLKTGAKLIRPERPPDAILDRAWRMLRMRRLVVRQRDAFIILPRQRPLLEYYRNSVKHLLPEVQPEFGMHPALEPDDSLPRLKPWRRESR
ncbi:MAG: glycerol-3-phosphate acyltransferase [Gemmatimonadales bacterium]|nr:glycerol-3-phosphate acyltransferase [Gemmatimonadales bacterium]NIN10094.1 glycerol-3-phosphate acyltransferase [Gemmatimonadales bacterium]NIR02578.1 glycerol-3-phosphate acyltransferase [Gemmatimonadales bacterium]NIS66272.1 glycerol-3-phosphate acyltransferase [Gemmatimonadales bacterium]